MKNHRIGRWVLFSMQRNSFRVTTPPVEVFAGGGVGREPFLKGSLLINGMKSSGKKRDNLGSIGKDFRWECNSIAESATKKEGNQPSFFVV